MTSNYRRVPKARLVIIVSCNACLCSFLGSPPFLMSRLAKVQFNQIEPLKLFAHKPNHLHFVHPGLGATFRRKLLNFYLAWRGNKFHPGATTDFGDFIELFPNKPGLITSA